MSLTTHNGTIVERKPPEQQLVLPTFTPPKTDTLSYIEGALLMLALAVCVAVGVAIGVTL